MKRFLSLIVFFLTLLFVQAQDACKIGYIERTILFENMPEVSQVEAQLSQLNILYTKEYDRMTAEYNDKVKAYMATSKSLSEPIKLARQAEITEYEERMALYKKRYTEELKKQTALLWVPINNKVKQAIATVAKAQGVSIVLDQATPLYVSESCVDLLPLVKQELGLQ
ncbi:MAG TPA: OmpH family outer membrane protein [Paludibacteraceae bacterium]|nr:OmpH family outer membrane protein [Paludibacteraceae bacterium]HQB68820.1 OmpH family outer membrane protein [Paludibacteraceae bacterium]HRS67483.1 OmpH family outer membrane protein [Paludibacteraceae bacterium]